MKVLVTGSAGFVGSHIVEHLLKNTDWDIIGVDSFRHRGDALRLDDDPEWEDIGKQRYEIYCHDLAAPFTHREIARLGDRELDIIINCASESHVDRSIEEPVPFVENNVKLALNVLELARRQKKLTHFFQVSTDEVYGAAYGTHRHKEWEPILPSNPYAASKAAQEAIAISYWRTYGVPLVITNTMNMIGERQDSEKFLPMLIGRISRGEEVTIHGNEKAVGSRFYLHARNFADALLFLAKLRPPAKYRDCAESALMVPDRFNVVGEEEVDNLALAQQVAAILCKPLKHRLVDFHAARPGHDRRYALDGGKLSSLGWKAPIPLWDSVQRTIDWTLAHKEWL